ncbi:hypothetical protein [Natronomonas salsuginis]|uniref:DUF8076 domain-containing protein n=1 Tax=Natronomonas salsuginis TaxID=2217661 RepID=A0A4U5JDX5_9EURY|nr:hypothetical protein [Natronomonas salsuginis]TKR25837.1 hypothetical protein DM868_04860 [Natronomonas salsuginis]
MSLNAGYNLVTERVEDTEEELPALAFFRRLANDGTLPPRLTVTRLEDLLYETDADELDEAARKLRDVLRESGSFRGPKAVQFVFDGDLVDDDVFSVRVERGGDAVYLPVGNLFVEEPRVVKAGHAVARK